MRLDFSCINNDNIDDLIYSFLPLKKNDIRIYESYCEFWAIVLNSCFSSFFHTKIKNNYENMFNKFMKIIQNEISFSIFQMNKILNHYNLKYTDLINNESNSKCKNYKEDTYVISYFILKTILLYSINDFFHWIQKYNGSIKFKHSNIFQFINFFKNHYLSNNFIQDIQKIQTIQSNNKFINNTLRMSVYEEN